MRQKVGEPYTFSCGCSGVLPDKKGKISNFALWNGKIWGCYKHYLLHRLKNKTEVFTKYCNGTPHCQCVGCRNGKDNPVHIGALQIDHINGDGKEHRKQLGSLRGNSFYLWLKRNGYPEGFQVLCSNCNFSKGNKKQCPCYGQDH